MHDRLDRCGDLGLAPTTRRDHPNTVDAGGEEPMAGNGRLISSKTDS
jgi:hypothetical protein